jgi:hypothetical protein
VERFLVKSTASVALMGAVIELHGARVEVCARVDWRLPRVLYMLATEEKA